MLHRNCLIARRTTSDTVFMGGRDNRPAMTDFASVRPAIVSSLFYVLTNKTATCAPSRHGRAVVPAIYEHGPEASSLGIA